MLKFAVDKQDVALIGLGLAAENLRLLRLGQAIQFQGAELGLQAGVFVIAHANDPLLPQFRALLTTAICELVVLTETDCDLMTKDLLTRQLRVTRQEKPCTALLFSGTTEAGMVEALRERGLVTDATRVSEQPAQPAERSTYGVGIINQLKMVGAAVVSLVLAIAVFTSSRMAGQTSLGELCVACGLVFLGLAYVRFRERVILDGRSLRRECLIGGFTVSWPELERISTASDSLGVYKLRLDTRDGRVHHLHRGYDDWEELVRRVHDAVT